jgi:hypothetical protein
LIGWRATEQPFLRLLATGLKSPPATMIVAGDKTDLQQTEQNLFAAGVAVRIVGSEMGFSRMITNRSAGALLRR